LACAGTAAGAAHSNAPTARTRATAASNPMCCFSVSIFADEILEAHYKPESSGTPKGDYRYHLEGTAYGLAKLYPSLGVTQGVHSTEGGVAEGFASESSNVTLEAEPFGCSTDHPVGIFENQKLAFRRAVAGEPEYNPPPGHGDIVGTMGFGNPFGGGGPFDPACSWATDVENESYAVLRAKTPQARFLTALQDGPIFGYRLSVGGLLKGEHKKEITCFQEASVNPSSPPREFVSRIAIIIDIVHYSPDDRRRLVHKLRSYIGHKPPEENAASRLADKDEETNHANGCSSSS
jgi:hypothetical protein